MSVTEPGDVYLGDGAYASYDSSKRMIRVYTSNGLRVTNEVWFEPETWKSLVRLAEQIGWLHIGTKADRD